MTENKQEAYDFDGKPEVYMSEKNDQVQWVASVPVRDKKDKTQTAKIRTGISKDRKTAVIEAKKAIDESCQELGLESKTEDTAIQEVDSRR